MHKDSEPMATYRFKIVGVHYAINPDSISREEESELMHQRTTQRLLELEEKRPVVVLIPEPTNPVDARAVMARVEGMRIGYVDKTQLDMLHAIFQTGGVRILKASIESVEARKHGWMNVCVEVEEEVCVEPQNQQDSPWTEWTSNLPELPIIDSRFAQMEAEVMSQISTPSQELLPRIRTVIYKLEKQRTAICGQKRMNLRVGKWWKALMASEEMDRLWKTWVARIGGNWEQGVNELVTPLRALPFDLYVYIDDKKVFFSRLHYSQVPRTQYWQVVSLMLLRERTLMEMKQEEGGYETYHPAGNETFTVTIPKELQTPEAKKVLARLQKKGLLDEDLQPVKLSNTQKAVLAWELTERLRIKKRWAVMATLWKCNPETLRKSRDKGYDKNVSHEFEKFIKPIIHY